MASVPCALIGDGRALLPLGMSKSSGHSGRVCLWL